MQAIQSIEQMNKSIFGSFNTKFFCIFIFLVFWLDNKKKYSKPLTMSDKLLLMNKHLLLMLCFFRFFAFTFAGWISRFFHGFSFIVVFFSWTSVLSSSFFCFDTTSDRIDKIIIYLKVVESKRSGSDALLRMLCQILWWNWKKTNFRLPEK